MNIIRPTAAKAGIALAALALLASCGRYYNADVAGYVRDAEDSAGIDGAVINLYLEEPASATAEGFIVRTSSMTQAGNAGYFSHRVIWPNALPEFGEEGDSGTVWLGIVHEDYYPAVVAVQGILSDTLNVIPDTVLQRAFFSVPALTGTVVDGNGVGVNGVRLVLDLASTTDNEQDYVVFSALADGANGRFSFSDVEWRDPDNDPATPNDTESARLFVADTNYRYDFDPSPANPWIDVTLAAGEEQDIADPAPLVQIAFACPQIQGRILNQAGEGANGVQVILDLDSTPGVDQDYAAVTQTWNGTAGTYLFTNVAWDDATPQAATFDEEPAALWIDDAVYEWVTGATPRRLALNLVSDQALEVAQTVQVTRIPVTSFTSRAQGRCLYRFLDINDQAVTIPVRGVQVTLSYTDDAGVHARVTETDANGAYSFTVSWDDATPGDYAAADPQIPTGEDGLLIDLSFSSSTNPGDRYSFPLITGFRLKSWIDPCTCPDSIDTDPNA